MRRCRNVVVVVVLVLVLVVLVAAAAITVGIDLLLRLLQWCLSVHAGLVCDGCTFLENVVLADSRSDLVGGGGVYIVTSSSASATSPFPSSSSSLVVATSSDGLRTNSIGWSCAGDDNGDGEGVGAHIDRVSARCWVYDVIRARYGDELASAAFAASSSSTPSLFTNSTFIGNIVS